MQFITGKKGSAALQHAYDLMRNVAETKPVVDTPEAFSQDLYVVCAELAFQVGYRQNPSWAPVRNEVHPSEFVFQKSWLIASDFCGIQTHEGELCFARAHMIDFISSAIFFPVITSQRTSEIILKSSEIAVRCRKLQLSMEERVDITKTFGPLLYQ